MVWRPSDTGAGRFPLVIYSHGTYSPPDNALYFIEPLVQRGYIVAAPTYPLTSRAAHTKLPAAATTDAVSQPGDISFIIDQLLADAELGQLIDVNAIGATGHSLGGVTSYFLSFGENPERRIAATALIAGGDPVGAAAMGLGFATPEPPKAHPPILFLVADKDVFAPMSGDTHAAYARVSGPKYEILIRDGVHVYFCDDPDTGPRADGKNPDCNFFDINMPGAVVPGCEAPGLFMARERQQEIARDALLSFFDAHLKQDEAAFERLSNLDKVYPEITLELER